MAIDAPKPRTRNTAEPEGENLNRYPGGLFVPQASGELGVQLRYFDEGSQGAAIVDFLTLAAASDAKKFGLHLFDVIEEVDGCPIGFLRGRFYEPFTHFKGDAKRELLVSFVKRDGNIGYYYPKGEPDEIQQRLYYIQAMQTPVDRGWLEKPLYDKSKKFLDGYFTADKPDLREIAEDELYHFARYRFFGLPTPNSPGDTTFQHYGRWMLGALMNYSPNPGAAAVVASVSMGSPAANAGLVAGDEVLEVNEAPVGTFAAYGPGSKTRVYQTFRRANRSSDGKIELLVRFRESGVWKCYYPVLQAIDLTKRS